MRNLPQHRRAAIEGEIEMCLARVDRLLARLDRADAPLEDLEDDDPGGTDLDHGEAGDDEGRGLLPARPFYSVDQTAKPLNHREADAEHYARGNGMVKGPDGKWRWPVVDGRRG